MKEKKIYIYIYIPVSITTYLVYGTYLPVALVVFVKLKLYLKFVTAWVRDRKGVVSRTYMSS